MAGRIRRLPPYAGIGYASCKPVSLLAITSPQSMLYSGRSSCSGRRRPCSKTAEYHFYGALSRAAHYRCAPADEGRAVLDALALHHRQLQVWAENCPENFENRAALVAAEIARIEGRDARRNANYTNRRSVGATQWIRPQRGAGNELAARFYAARGFGTISHAYHAKRPLLLLCVGEPTARCGNSTSCTRISGRKSASPAPTSTIGTPVESPRPRDRDQGVAGRLGRDRPGKADRHAHAHRDRAGGRRARFADSSARRSSSG